MARSSAHLALPLIVLLLVLPEINPTTVMVLAAAVMLPSAASAMDVGSSSFGGVGGSGMVGNVGGDGGLVRSNVGGDGMVRNSVGGDDSMVGSSVRGDGTMGSSGGGNGRMGRSFGGDGGQGDEGLLLPVMQDQFHGLDVGEYSVVGDSDSLFMEQHRRNMHWVFELQNTFDAWLDNMDNNLGLEDEADMINDGVDNVEVVAMNGVEDVAVAMDGHEAHQFDVLTAGEKVIFDIMFDIHHPNFYRDDNGVYRYRAD